MKEADNTEGECFKNGSSTVFYVRGILNSPNKFLSILNKIL